jgi:mRNA interferase HigB
MVIISKATINKFIEKYPRSAEPLLKWYLEVKDADWGTFPELKRTFPAADYVGNGLVIFNIGGNKWRLIVRIIFGARTVFIRMIGTHTEYDKVKLSDL